VPVSIAGRDQDVDDHLVSLLEPASFEAEQYRTLRHTVGAHRAPDFRYLRYQSSGAMARRSPRQSPARSPSSEARVLADVDLRHLGERTPRAEGRRSRGLVDAILDPADTDHVVQRPGPYNRQ
jgi:hypothetical protein